MSRRKPARPILPAAPFAAQPKPQLMVNDLQNLVFAARHALPRLSTADAANVIASIARVEQVLAAPPAPPAEPTPAPPAAD